MLGDHRKRKENFEKFHIHCSDVTPQTIHSLDVTPELFTVQMSQIIHCLDVTPQTSLIQQFFNQSCCGSAHYIVFILFDT